MEISRRDMMKTSALAMLGSLAPWNWATGSALPAPLSHFEEAEERLGLRLEEHGSLVTLISYRTAWRDNPNITGLLKHFMGKPDIGDKVRGWDVDGVQRKYKEPFKRSSQIGIHARYLCSRGYKYKTLHFAMVTCKTPALWARTSRCLPMCPIALAYSSSAVLVAAPSSNRFYFLKNRYGRPDYDFTEQLLES